MTKDYFIDLAKYNGWANDKYLTWLRAISDEQWGLPLTSSFGTIGDTALHIAAAEKIWHERLILAEKPIWLVNIMSSSRNETLAAWKTASDNLLSFVSAIPVANLNEVLNFKRINGEAAQLPVYKVLAHIFNHSTYHRGQLLLLLRQAGYTEVESTDYLRFATKPL